MRPSRWWLLAAAVPVSLFVALGFWQLSRANFKEAQRVAIVQAQRAAPVALARALAAGQLPLRVELAADAAQSSETLALPLPVIGGGSFDDSATVLLDNQTRDRRAGVQVYTLFRPAEGARALLVDRGWLALPIGSRELPIPPVGGERVELRGMLSAPPPIGWRMGNATYVAGQRAPMLTYIDLAQLARELRVELFHGVLVLAPDAPGAFEPRAESATGGMSPERHRGYAAQWFALALAMCVITWVVRRRAARMETKDE